MPTTLITIDTITIAAAPEAIFRASAAIEHWPEILPHYRRVTLLEESFAGRIVEMAAWRGVIPVTWQAVQTLHPELWVIYYRHLAGPTRGMEVTWALEPRDDGVQVIITHNLSLKAPFIRSALGAWVVGYGFVKPIAKQTLRHLKRYCEEAPCAVP